MPPDRFPWRTPRCLACLLPLRPEAVTVLSRRLRQWGDAVDKTPGLDLSAVGSLHYFRLQILHDPLNEHGPQLLFSTVFDGDVREHARELDQHIGQGLMEMCRGCFPPPVNEMGESLAELLIRHRLDDDTIYLGLPGGSATDIQANQRLREILSELADEQLDRGAWHDQGSEAIRMAMRRHMARLPDGETWLSAPVPPRLSLRLREWFDAALAAVSPLSGLLHGELRMRLLATRFARRMVGRAITHTALAAHFLWTAIPTLLFLRLVRRLERNEVFEASQPSLEDVQGLAGREDHQAQNPLTLYAAVRDHAMRRWTLRRILHGAYAATRHIWNRGDLAGIGTIHCARILQVQGGRRFLFLSDYDGSWSRYLEDFLGPGRVAVVPIFSNLRGCPPTRALFGTTPGFGPRFLSFTRKHQATVQVWYSSRPQLSLSNLRSNQRLREGLARERMTDDEAAAWLRELG